MCGQTMLIAMLQSLLAQAGTEVRLPSIDNEIIVGNSVEAGALSLPLRATATQRGELVNATS